MRGHGPHNRDELIAEYQQYVHSIARKLIRSMGLPSDVFDEFVSAGYLGLVEAASRFDPNGGRAFKSFAFLRIRGAIIDHIRDNSQLPPRTYRKLRALEAAQEERERLEESLQNSTSRPEERLAHSLEFLARGALAFRLSMQDVEDEVAAAQTVDSPEAQVLEQEFGDELRALVETLPEKERLVVEEYYFNDKPFTQIADEYEGMSKSWVSRLHSRALALLKERYLEQLE